MKKKYIILALLSALVAMPALADSYDDRYDDRDRYGGRDRYDDRDNYRQDRSDRRDRYEEEDRYGDCKRRARRSTGYRGSAPRRHRSGNAFLEGAAKGAARGAIGGAISGGNAEKGARRGTAIGGLIGLIKNGKRNSRDREDRRRREDYHVELNACMGTR